MLKFCTACKLYTYIYYRDICYYCINKNKNN